MNMIWISHSRATLLVFSHANIHVGDFHLLVDLSCLPIRTTLHSYLLSFHFRFLSFCVFFFWFFSVCDFASFCGPSDDVLLEI